MSAESYSLAEAAELLGVSKRTLQRQIRDGAFPGRFLAPSAQGMELRIPAVEVARAGGHRDSMMLRATSEIEWSEKPLAPVSDLPVRSAGNGLSTGDWLELREGIVALIREERAVFLAEVRAAIERHEAASGSQLVALHQTIEKIGEEVAGIRTELRKQEALRDGRVSFAEAIGGKRSDLDIDGLLSELGALEAMLGVTET